MTLEADVIRRLYPSVLAKLLPFTRLLADAEDAVHEAIERALATWPTSGMPRSPEAWLVTVAKNVHRDHLRRARRVESHDTLDALAALSPCARLDVHEPDGLRRFDDELLGLLFACCHTCLEDGESAALALATVMGLSTHEVARAFLVTPRTMEQRLTRARQRLREQGGGAHPLSAGSLDRLPAVLRAIYLLFNEGYWSGDDDEPIRVDLCRLALELARALAQAYPAEPEVAGLLALFVFHEARRNARVDEQGIPVPLPQQDRLRWDRDAIARATALLEHALDAGRPGRMQVEAAIAAVHCRATEPEATDWTEIAALYALLEGFSPTPAVRVNRAFAVGRANGPAAGLALLARADIDAESYAYVHLVRAELHAQAGETDAAVRAFAAAVQCSRNSHERSQIEAKLRRVLAMDGSRL